jgi:hypothetical protein
LWGSSIFPIPFLEKDGMKFLLGDGHNEASDFLRPFRSR